MKVRHLRKADALLQPWRNGGGTTSEIAACIEDGRMVWRVSVADVSSDGPFSDFAGYDRVIMLLEGAGMALAFGDRPEVKLARKWRPLPFDGGWNTRCRLLEGPVRDLNLMVDRARAHGRLEVVEDAAKLATAATTLCHALEDSTTIEVDRKRHGLARGDTLWLEGAAARRVQLAQGAVALIRIDRR